MKMVGTEKQVAWAEKIKKEILERCDKTITVYQKMKKEEELRIAKQIREEIIQNESAAWFIENSWFSTPEEVKKRLSKEVR